MTVNYFPFLDDGERRKGRVQKTRSYGGARHGYPRSFSNEIDTIAAKLDLPMRFPIRCEWHHAGEKQTSCRSNCDRKQRSTRLMVADLNIYAAEWKESSSVTHVTRFENIRFATACVCGRENALATRQCVTEDTVRIRYGYGTTGIRRYGTLRGVYL
jgi:hypothetical protein